MTRSVVWTLGDDRPGIAAAITGPLFDLGANLEDCSMTILSGQFAVVLVVDLPAGVTNEDLERALAEPAARLDLGIAVRDAGDPPTPPTAGARCVLSVYGADQPGIVHRFVALLADARVNITDLATRVVGDPHDPAYTMVLDVVAPDGLELEGLQRRLAALAADVGVEASIRAVDVDVL